MESRNTPLCVMSAAVLLGMLCGGPALAQAPGCQVVQEDDPPRQVLHCADGLTLTAEQATAFRLLGGAKSGRPRAAELNDHGLLIEAPAGSLSRGFQVRTPHAVAAVRGTTWAMDVTADNTAVFVEQGVVSVRRAETTRGAVTLQAGDGVDVKVGGGALQVKRWPPARASALLARFGR